MNKAQKEVQQTQLNDEKKVIKLLELVYEQAKKDCEQKIRELSARTDLENLQSIIYQKEYQQIMVDQIESILYDLHEGQFTTIADYLQQSYINGYRTFYKYTLLRKSTCLEMEKKMTAIRNKVEAGNMMNYSEWCSINSYKGWLKYADTFRLNQKYVVPLLPNADDYYIRNIKPNTKKGLNAA